MPPPQVCPPPPDCPLYAQRLDYGVDEPLRRAILTERQSRPDLAAFVRAESLTHRRPSAALPPTPKPVRLPISDQLKKGISR